MTTLYITRHGETVWNVEGRMQGWKDSPLSDLGVKQANWLGERLKAVKLDAIYSSSSGRAYKTAEIIKGKRDMAIQKEDSLMEIGLGSWEGRLFSEVNEEEHEQFHAFFNAPHLYSRNLEESFEKLGNRVIPAVQRILSNHKEGKLLIVTHTVSLKLIMAYFENRPLERLWDPPFIHQTSLSIVQVDDEKCEILLHGDISHYRYKEV